MGACEGQALGQEGLETGLEDGQVSGNQQGEKGEMSILPPSSQQRRVRATTVRWGCFSAEDEQAVLGSQAGT